MGFPARRSMAANGESFLLVTEWPLLQQSSGRVRMQIRGWRLGAGGKSLDDTEAGLVLAAEEQRDQLLPAVAPGPKDVFLVVYSERRGPDDLKVVARIVKAQ